MSKDKSTSYYMNVLTKILYFTALQKLFHWDNRTAGSPGNSICHIQEISNFYHIKFALIWIHRHQN